MPSIRASTRPSSSGTRRASRSAIRGSRPIDDFPFVLATGVGRASRRALIAAGSGRAAPSVSRVLRRVLPGRAWRVMRPSSRENPNDVGTGTCDARSWWERWRVSTSSGLTSFRKRDVRSPRTSTTARLPGRYARRRVSTDVSVEPSWPRRRRARSGSKAASSPGSAGSCGMRQTPMVAPSPSTMSAPSGMLPATATSSWCRSRPWPARSTR